MYGFLLEMCGVVCWCSFCCWFCVWLLFYCEVSLLVGCSSIYFWGSGFWERKLLLTKSKDFVSILITSVLCLFVCVFVCLFVCLFVCRHDNSRTEEATNVKLHHVIQEGDG